MACPHKTLKKQILSRGLKDGKVVEQVWYRCECGQTFKAVESDGKVEVVAK